MNQPPQGQATPTTSDCPTCNPKPGLWCRGCPRETEHLADARLTTSADVIIVSEAPVVPKLYDLNKLHAPFTDDAGRIINGAIKAIQQDAGERRNSALLNVSVAKTYAVLCYGDDPSKEVSDRCANFLVNSIKSAGRTRKTPPVILAMGMTAVKSLGIKAKKLADVQSRVMPGIQIAGETYTVIPTLSNKMLVAMPGMYRIFESDLRRAMELASAADAIQTTVSLDELTKNYVIPKTLDEVRELSELVISYAKNGVAPESWAIAVDTETNTLFPHRDGTKMLCLSFAWDLGLAGAIALWHKDTPYDPALAEPYARAIVESLKPKCLHNAKYDLKVFRKYGWDLRNLRWDTMLAEHAIEEDKKGQYGLKQLTRVFAPEFAAYADELHVQHAREEGENQLDNIRKTKKDEALLAEPLLAPGKKPRGKKEKKSGGFEDVELDVLLKYAAVDTDMTRRLSLLQIQRMQREDKAYAAAKQRAEQDQAYKRDDDPTKRQVPSIGPAKDAVKQAYLQVSVPATRVLSDMEYEGIRVDRAYIQELDGKLGKIIEKTERELLQIAGNPDLKLNSAAAVANILFNHGYIDPDTGKRVLHVPVSTTATGQPQTTEKVLKALVAKSGCKFSTKKLIYAKAYKAKNTFIANVRDLSELDGFLHTNYNQHGTATYRLSSHDENMQNIPKKLAGYSIKKIFVPDDDSYLFVNADAKGAEVRIFTAYSRDKQLIASINDGFDTHCFIAAEIVKAVRKDPSTAAHVLEAIGLDDQYPLTYEDFDARDRLKLDAATAKYGDMLDKFRTAVKRVVFGILYGAGPKKIAETIGISHEQAQAIIDLLFSLFPSIPRYMSQTKWELSTFGIVETYFGRRRRFSVKGAAKYMLGRAERQSINFKIQSTSSDIVIGCLRDASEPLKKDLGGRMLLTVHDSLGFQLPKKYASQLPDFIEEHLVKRTALLYPWLPVAFKWDFEVGPSYGELQPLSAWLEKNPQAQQMTEQEEAYGEDDIKTDLRAVEDDT